MGGEWMMGKFVTASALKLLLLISLTSIFAIPGFSQTAPTDQTPAAAPAAAPAAPAPETQQDTQQPSAPASTAQAPAAQAPAAQPPASGQETAEEESTSHRKKRAHDYKNWNFNVGAGANVDSGSTKTFVRGGGVLGTIGVARNASKYLGLRADFIYEDLPLRDSSLAIAQATGATSYVLAFTLGPIINIPVTKEFSGYVLFGPGFYHRGGSLNDDTAVPGSACNPFWTWWGACPGSSLGIPLSGSFVDSSQNEFGYNIGAGVARKMPSGVEIYAEYRLTHGSANHTTTDTRPITIGVRW
jgi:opacity protein-like surface antigen